MQVAPVAVDPEGSEAPPTHLLHDYPLESDVTPCRWMVQGFRDLTGSPPFPAHHCDRPLVRRRDECLGGKACAGEGQPQPLEARFGEDDSIELPLFQLAQPRVNVSPEWCNPDVRVVLEQLCPSARTRGANDPYLVKRNRVDEKVGRGVAFENCARDQSSRSLRRDVLCTVDGSVDLAPQECIVECADKDALPPYLVQGHAGHGVPEGRDDHLLRPDPPPLQERDHFLRLGECKCTAACSNQERHCLYAMQMVSTSAQVCAEERKLVSN